MENQEDQSFYSNNHPFTDSTKGIEQEEKLALRLPNIHTMVLEFENENVSIHWGLN